MMMERHERHGNRMMRRRLGLLTLERCEVELTAVPELLIGWKTRSPQPSIRITNRTGQIHRHCSRLTRVVRSSHSSHLCLRTNSAAILLIFSSHLRLRAATGKKVLVKSLVKPLRAMLKTVLRSQTDLSLVVAQKRIVLLHLTCRHLRRL